MPPTILAEQIVSMPALKRRYTAAEVRRLIEETAGHWPRYELIDGELLVSPAPTPRHQWALAWLYDLLSPYVRAEGIGRAYWSPADLELEPGQITQPDIFVVPQSGKTIPASWVDVQSLLLAVDALSPSTATNNRVIKRPYYQRVSVAEYWLMDLDARRIERWYPRAAAPELATRTLAWHPAGASQPLVIELEDLWSAVTD